MYTLLFFSSSFLIASLTSWLLVVPVTSFCFSSCISFSRSIVVAMSKYFSVNGKGMQLTVNKMLKDVNSTNVDKLWITIFGYVRKFLYARLLPYYSLLSGRDKKAQLN